MKQHVKQHHNLTIEWLDHATVDEIAAVEPATLERLRIALGVEAGILKFRLAQLDGGTELRYRQEASIALSPKGQVGTIHLDDGEYDVTVTADKTVKWDEDMLASILDAMEPDLAKHYAKVKVSVGEREYLAAPPAIQELLRPARTVKSGKWKIELKRKAQEAA